jgi:hypothetical protein
MDFTLVQINQLLPGRTYKDHNNTFYYVYKNFKGSYKRNIVYRYTREAGIWGYNEVFFLQGTNHDSICKNFVMLQFKRLVGLRKICSRTRPLDCSR